MKLISISLGNINPDTVRTMYKITVSIIIIVNLEGTIKQQQMYSWLIKFLFQLQVGSCVLQKG